MDSCSQCGAAVPAGAKFCSECGNCLDRTGAPGRSHARGRRAVLWGAGIGAILVLGGAATTAIVMMGRAGAAHQPAALAPAAGMAAQSLPPGHPNLKVPSQTTALIAKARKEAEARPNDLAAWNRLGDLALHAAIFDPANYQQASDAFSRVLKADPNNCDALRGMGNVDFDEQHFSAAIASYDRYRRCKPNDPDVLTDLGTMYLATKHYHQALAQYQKALAARPGFFPATFNTAVAYLMLKDNAQAHAALEKARAVAPNAVARSRIDRMIARLEGKAVANLGSEAGAAQGPHAGFAGHRFAAASGTQPAAPTFQGAVEQVVRGLPVAGAHVTAVQWPAQNKAVVLMRDFPMSRMPSSDRTQLLGDIRSGVARAKAAYRVAGTVEVELEDAGTNRPMASVTD